MTFLSVTESAPGQVAAWLVYAGFGVAAWGWVFLLLPETKGKSLPEILQLFGVESPIETQLLEPNT